MNWTNEQIKRFNNHSKIDQLMAFILFEYDEWSHDHHSHHHRTHTIRIEHSNRSVRLVHSKKKSVLWHICINQCTVYMRFTWFSIILSLFFCTYEFLANTNTKLTHTEWKLAPKSTKSNEQNKISHLANYKNNKSDWPLWKSITKWNE